MPHRRLPQGVCTHNISEKIYHSKSWEVLARTASVKFISIINEWWIPSWHSWLCWVVLLGAIQHSDQTIASTGVQQTAAFRVPSKSCAYQKPAQPSSNANIFWNKSDDNPIILLWHTSNRPRAVQPTAFVSTVVNCVGMCIKPPPLQRLTQYSLYT